MRYLIVCLICLGSALMVYNIVRYYGFLSHIKKMESLGETRKTAVIPLVLLVCFLIGYLTVGFLGKPDIIVALILFGGSIYVSMVLMFLYRIVYQLEQNEIRMEALYKQVRSEVRSLTRNALAVFRVNLTRDVIEERGGTSLYESDYVQGSYTDLVNSRRHNILTRDSAAGFLSFDRDSLINCFEKGQTNVEEVLFCSGASGQECFVLAHASLAAQPVTGDVVAFITEKLYNDEMVNDTLLNRALVGQYDMIAYLVDGRYGVVIGEKEPDKQGNIFPDCNTGLYSDYLKDKLAPALCGTGDERAAIMESLSEKEVERQLSDKDSYDVSFSCEIDGELYYKNFSFYTVDAEAKFYVVLEYDTTEARQEEQVRAEKLEVALEEARRASAAKTVFLSNMSHDIRTPMNAIIGYVNMAKRDTTDSRLVSEYLDKIDSSSQYLLALINDVLEMSRIESGKLELEAVPVDLRKLLNEVRDMFATQMREKGIAFEVSYERLSDPGVLCDENRFNRVLLNLLSNAYKFTPENGSISVILRQNDTVKLGSGEYELRVKDSGIGMEPEFAERVFEAFERERNSTVSGIQGTGLGMAITKNIIDMMGGTIDVETAPGQGTEFIIRLSMPVCEDVEPFEAVAVEEKQDELTFSDFTSVHALLVEDVEVNREIATFMLEDMGFSIDTAENGRIAVEKVRASEPGYYDIILMDVQMPEMNGYEAARSIRSLPDPELSNIPIVAMTANAFSEDIREAKNAGMNDHISKPLDIEQMQETLKRVLGGAN